MNGQHRGAVSLGSVVESRAVPQRLCGLEFATAAICKAVTFRITPPSRHVVSAEWTRGSRDIKLAGDVRSTPTDNALGVALSWGRVRQHLIGMRRESVSLAWNCLPRWRFRSSLAFRQVGYYKLLRFASIPAIRPWKVFRSSSFVNMSINMSLWINRRCSFKSLTVSGMLSDGTVRIGAVLDR